MPRISSKAARPSRGADPFRAAILAQGLGTLAMLKDCITLCPDEHWKGIIGKYPF